MDMTGGGVDVRRWMDGRSNDGGVPVSANYIHIGR